MEARLLAEIYGTLEETPIAQVALSEDRVVAVTGDLGALGTRALRAHLRGSRRSPARRSRPAGAGWGSIFADRGGDPLRSTDAERHAMWTLGKTAALAASVRIATNQHGRARLLQARIDLAREIHERVVQRLFGVSLVLGSEGTLSEEVRKRCADEMQAALHDLRDALASPLAHPSLDTGATLREELARLGRHYKDLPLELELGGRRGGPRACRGARPVGAGRGTAQRAEARRADPRASCASGAPTARSCSRSETTAPMPARARRGPGWACAWPRSRRCSAGRSWSSAPRARSGASARGADRGRVRRMSPDRGLRVLVVDDHDVVHWGFRLLLDRAALGRALPDGVEPGGGAGAGAPLRAARGAGRPVPRRGVGRRALRGDPPRGRRPRGCC